MKNRPRNLSLAVLSALAILAVSCLGFLWVQNDLLRTTASALSMSAPAQERDSAFLASVTSAEDLRSLASSRTRAQQGTLALVDTTTHNLALGLAALGVLLVLVFFVLALVIRSQPTGKAAGE